MRKRLMVWGALLLTVPGCSLLPHKTEPPPARPTPREQLSIGYSLLYQEADGVPKLNWLLKFKEKPEDMGRLTAELIDYYEKLAATLRRLAQQYPNMRINVQPMSDIEGAARKAIGTDLAKEMAPVVGKTGVDFERTALLMFYNSLDEQRHLVEVMAQRESEPGLKQFLQTTHGQLESRYAKVGELLQRRYFTH